MKTNEQKLKAASEAIEEAFKVVSRPTNTSRLAKNTLKSIIKRTRLGNGISKQINGRRVKLRKLSESYKETRKGNIRFFKNKGGSTYAIKKGKKKSKLLGKPKNISSLTRPSKSNLTATNQLLRSFKSIGSKAKLILFLARNARVGDLFDKSKRVETTNREILLLQELKGRRFFGLTKTEFNKLENTIRGEILDASERFINKSVE